MNERSFDLAVIGGGIVGLGHALAARRRGLSVVLFERDAAANGASVRNFGFVTVTGQQRGRMWRLARRTAEIWREIAPRAGIEILHRGLLVAGRRPEAAAVLEAFAASEMAEDCALLSADRACELLPALEREGLCAALFSPHEVRIEASSAIGKLTSMLEREGVEIRANTHVRAIDLPRIETSSGAVRAEAAVLCPGTDFLSLRAERLGELRATRLQMMRIAPERPMGLDRGVMSDLGLIRYRGYSELPEAEPLARRLEAERAEALEAGVHLIAVQSADGSLVVGDSHHAEEPPSPFGEDRVDRLILDEFDAVFGPRPKRITHRWSGVYARHPEALLFEERVSQRERICIVACGAGMSTAFALGEETIAAMFD